MGFTTVEYLAAALLDMEYHSIKEPVSDIRAFEKAAMAKAGLIPEILPRYRSTYFAHIFSGGYAIFGYALHFRGHEFLHFWQCLLARARINHEHPGIDSQSLVGAHLGD